MSEPIEITPLPWRWLDQGESNSFLLLGANDKWVISFRQNGELTTAREKSNADFIVLACNVHHELLGALNELLEQTVDQDLNHGICLTEGEAAARERALAAIAKATGKENAE
ncbi:MAG: hypothetical protein QM627_04830 [Luteolibacter sp.]